MKEFGGRIAVITGAGTGMGRALARALASEGCHLALGDIRQDTLEEASRIASEGAPAGTRISTHLCDVSVEEEVLAFRDAVLREHDTDGLHLVFNNPGISGGGSFLREDRGEWERCFGVNWFGVYFGSRAFLPLLVAAEEGYLVNTSSVNGFWASLGAQSPHTAYSASKFAVKGFSEALLNDLRINAPHVKVAVVMPGHVGTSIVENSTMVLGRSPFAEMGADELTELRERWTRLGLPVAGMDDDALRAALVQRARDFEQRAPTSADQAAQIILDGVREERWRILIGEDAARLDQMVRDAPEQAYEPEFAQRVLAEVFTASASAATRGDSGDEG